MGLTLPTSRSYTIEEAYKFYCDTASDISEELPYLLEYGKKVDHITEFGVRKGRSTVGWLYAKPKVLLSYELRHNRLFIVDRYKQWAEDNGVHFEYKIENVLAVTISPTDLLFIDTYHTYTQLKKELQLHGNQARKYIAFHDTNYNRDRGEDKKTPGLKAAIDEFIEEHNEWKIVLDLKTHSGLIIIERK